MSNQDDLDASRSAPVDTVSGLLRAWRWPFCLIGLGVAIVGFYGEENWRGQRTLQSTTRS